MRPVACSAKSASTVASVSISAGVLSSRMRTMRGKRMANPDRCRAAAHDPVEGDLDHDLGHDASGSGRSLAA